MVTGDSRVEMGDLINMCAIDTKAAGSLYARHAPNLRRLLTTQSMVVGPALIQDGVRGGSYDGDDIVQETFVRLLSSRECTRLAACDNPVPYLLAVARNLQYDILRRRRRLDCPSKGCVLPYSGLEAGDAAALVAEVTRATSDGLEYTRRASEMGNALVRCIADLDPNLRATYHTRFVMGLSQRKAAEALGITRRRIRRLEQVLIITARRRMTATDNKM